eukprot:TRINITY_DN35834_c0_g1_i1.p1 TRINITY_DN35834_c0_g1~~TRINITY_DN35834_c0_g1_i1.p1  ORF type:complete len:372 (-),score=64.87 TRINITY_DN35834_c0_g1_i1:100-1215(-)
MNLKPNLLLPAGSPEYQFSTQCCGSRDQYKSKAVAQDLQSRSERIYSIATLATACAAVVGGYSTTRFQAPRRKKPFLSTLRAHKAIPMATLRAASQSAANATTRLPFLYGTAWKKESTADLVVQAVQQGFRGIDTACQPKHYREDLVGSALARLAAAGTPREQLWLQTKFTPLPSQDPANVPYDPEAPLSKQVEQSIDRSLKNLGTQHIDSLVLHTPLPTLEQTLEVWNVLEKVVDSGTVGQLGISNCYDYGTFKTLYETVRVKPQVLQNRFYKDSGYDLALRSFCLQNMVTYQSFWTLTANPHLLESEPVRRAASRLRATPQQVLFRWLIQSGHQPLTGTKSLEHMRQDLSVVNLTLADVEMKQIGELLV